MKKLLFTVFACLSMGSTNAQTVAADWTLSDCDGNSHNLFTYLNNEEVVIMAFAMGCSSCYDAGPGLIGKRNDYAVSHPGKVKAFYMDYWAGNDCAADILPNVGMYDYDGIMEHCNAEKTYYFGASVPMPGIVIAAGSTHEIIYQSISFTEGDTLQIQQAIDSFFMFVSVKEPFVEIEEVNLYPNPANTTITIEIRDNGPGTYAISIFDVTGKLTKVCSEVLFVNGNKQLDISSLPKGLYSMNITNGNTNATRKLLIE